MVKTDTKMKNEWNVTVKSTEQQSTKSPTVAVNPSIPQKANKPKKSKGPLADVMRPASAPDDCIVRLNFHDRFSLMQNIEFTNKVADAEKIIFDRVLYAVCSDVSTAEKVRLDTSRLKLTNNKVLSSRRLGPAYCAFTSPAKKDPKVLTLCKLPVATTYTELKKRFPEALDIATRTTMAKVVFSSAEDCEAAYYEAQTMRWPNSCIVSLKWYANHNYHPLEEDQEEDPDVLLCSHPRQFSLHPHVVAITLAYQLELKSQMELLEACEPATDIVLSKFCRLVYNTPAVTWQRRKELQGITMTGGGSVMAWANGAVLGAISKGAKGQSGDRCKKEVPAAPQSEMVEDNGLGQTKEKKKKKTASQGDPTGASPQPAAKKMKLSSKPSAKKSNKAERSPETSVKKFKKGSKKLKTKSEQ